MNILQLIDSLNAGGAERMAVNISNILSQNGYKVVLCASHSSGLLEKFVDKDVILVNLGKKNGFDLLALIRLLKHIRYNKIDLIHAHSSSVYWATLVKIFFPKIKIIWHDHFGGSEQLTHLNRKSIQIISRYFDGIIVVNEKLKLWSIENTKTERKNIKYIRNFPLLNPKDNVQQKEIGLLQIVCLANFRPQKDHLTLINALDILINQLKIQNINVVLAGLYTEDSYYYTIIDTIKSKKLEKFIQIVGSVSDTASLLFTSQIGVLSSISEGLPVSLLEYGLAGLAVVVTDVGQCSEVLENGEVGIVVPHNNPNAFADALFTLIQNESKRKEIGEKFKKNVEEKFGYKNFLEQYENLITVINAR